jgi:hypothetical protein
VTDGQALLNFWQPRLNTENPISIERYVSVTSPHQLTSLDFKYCTHGGANHDIISAASVDSLEVSHVAILYSKIYSVGGR